MSSRASGRWRCIECTSPCASKRCDSSKAVTTNRKLITMVARAVAAAPRLQHTLRHSPTLPLDYSTR
eukprot:scaffold76268_cov75-Phaeocystis_antarctica.AAC.5